MKAVRPGEIWGFTSPEGIIASGTRETEDLLLPCFGHIVYWRMEITPEDRLVV
jgi:hypothetical protein